MRPGAIVGPLILIGLGTLFLLNNMGMDIPLRYLFRNFWPVILIVAGLAQIAGAAVRGRGSVVGGAIVTTVGCLFLLQQWWEISFRHTWPVLLIAIGATGLLRALLGPAMSMHRGAGRFMRGGLPR